MRETRNEACRHYRGDRPCQWNKRDQSECATCTHADPIKERILIVKLDAIGDVLRSTVILPKLKQRHPAAHITWLTRAASAPLLAGNPYVDQIWRLDDPETTVFLSVQAWDIVINLDNAPISGALAAKADGRRKIGFTLNPQGAITPSNEAASTWLSMAVFDRLKKENALSYQEHMYAICGFEPPIERPVLVLTDAMRSQARERVRGGWLQDGEKLIGLNTGAGGRWPLKMLSEDRQRELISALLTRADIKVVLLGGPGERERNMRMAAALDSHRVRNAGCDHGLLEFAALVAECDALICGDTLALHIATALGVPSVAVFCPTSLQEIHDYDGLITKIGPTDCECFCGYNRDCPSKKDCINRIPLERICDAARNQADARRA